MTLGTVGLYPASTAMLTRLVPGPARERVYGFQFMLLNAGLGVGGVVSALSSTSDPCVLPAALPPRRADYVAYIAVVLSLPRGHRRLAAPEAPRGAGPQPGWGAVLRDRTLLRVVLISMVVITFGYAQFEAGFAAYTVDVADIPPTRSAGPSAPTRPRSCWGQLVTLRLIKGRRRSRMLALCAAIWSVSWAVIASSDAVDGRVAVTLVVVGLGIFGLGETLWAPVAPAIVNDLATEELRGRYNALQGMTWTVAMIVGPALAGLLIGNDLAHVWVACTVGGTALAAVLLLPAATAPDPGPGRLRPAEVSLAA